MFDNTLEYVKGCDVNNSDHIWYYNIWTPSVTESTTEISVPTIIPEPNEISEVIIPTKIADPNDIIVPFTVSEEKPTKTITTTVTAVMTEAY